MKPGRPETYANGSAPSLAAERILQPSAAILFSQAILKWRWWIMLALGLCAAAFEVLEHWPIRLDQLDPNFVRQTLFFAFFLPLSWGFLLTLLSQTEGERAQAIDRLSRHEALGEELSQAASWVDILDSVVRYPRTVAPVIATSLHLYIPEKQAFELAASWAEGGREQPPLPSWLSLDACPSCARLNRPAIEPLLPCVHEDIAGTGATPTLYCQALVHSGRVVALMHIQFSPEITLSFGQMRALTTAGPELALAVANARLERSAMAQTEAAVLERRRIAQTLHDTLGQDLGYLRLKLDQLTGEDALWEISVVKEDLERMRTVADEAYKQVRRTLTELHPASSTDLAMTLLKYAREVGERACFTVQLTSRGQPRPLPVEIKSQVLFIAREALNNIEKHAQAAEVRLHLAWDERTITLDIQDDGQGFDPVQKQSHGPLSGHYGLNIMCERAAAIGAQLDFLSSPGRGTTIRLKIYHP